MRPIIFRNTKAIPTGATKRTKNNTILIHVALIDPLLVNSAITRLRPITNPTKMTIKNPPSGKRISALANSNNPQILYPKILKSLSTPPFDKVHKMRYMK